jgi:hypothetical protein
LKEKFGYWLELHKTKLPLDRDTYMINNKFCVDYFIRFEDLYGGIKYVCEVLDIPFEPERIPKLKSGNRHTESNLSDYYDSRSVEIISEAYNLEISYLGYTSPL